MRPQPSPTALNSAQRPRFFLRILRFRSTPSSKDANGSQGGRGFKSRRPDQWRSPLLWFISPGQRAFLCPGVDRPQWSHFMIHRAQQERIGSESSNGFDTRPLGVGSIMTPGAH